MRVLRWSLALVLVSLPVRYVSAFNPIPLEIVNGPVEVITGTSNHWVNVDGKISVIGPEGQILYTEETDLTDVSNRIIDPIQDGGVQALP